MPHGNNRRRRRDIGLLRGAAATAGAAAGPRAPRPPCDVQRRQRDDDENDDELYGHRRFSQTRRDATWYTTSAATYASPVMYANVNAGQRQLFVSRRMTASVEAHWQHRAKNTISDSAPGTPSFVRRMTRPNFVSATSVDLRTSSLSTLPTW